jgi:hypothetical protein
MSLLPMHTKCVFEVRFRAERAYARRLELAIGQRDASPERSGCTLGP